MKRWSFWLIGLLGGLGILAASGILWISPGFAPSNDDGSSVITNISTKGRARPEDVLQGHLGIKYLTEQELKLVGLQRDLDRVKYHARLDLRRWALGCRMGIDCIVAITSPGFESVEEADSWLRPGDLVLSVEHLGLVKAYPLRILEYHEIVNDTLKGEPVLITFCPLCFSASAFKRPLLSGRPLEFRVSGRLYNANLIMVDRQTGSFWDQILGEVLMGPLVGRVGPLLRLPADLVYWEDWKQAHPEGRVLARPTEIRGLRGLENISPSRYERSPYEEYMLRPSVGFGVDIKEIDLRRLAAKRLVFGVELSGRAKAYADGSIQKVKLLNDLVGEGPILVVVTPEGAVRAFRRTLSERDEPLTFELRGDMLRDLETETLWSFSGEGLSGPLARKRLEEIPVIPTYWFAWLLFHPDTEVFRQR